MTGFDTPFRAELPLDGLEAFRLASFGLEYVPQYAPVMVDAHNAANRWYHLTPSAFSWFAPDTLAALAALEAMEGRP